MSGPRVVVSIDPGKHLLGAAVFVDGILVQAKLIEGSMNGHLGDALADWMFSFYCDPWGFDGVTIVLEKMRVYPPAQQKGDPNDLVDVSLQGALSVGYLANGLQGANVTIETVYPATWKGQMKKALANTRVINHLSEKERGNIEPCPASLRHNVLDGVGIGLYWLGKTGQRPGWRV